MNKAVAFFIIVMTVVTISVYAGANEIDAALNSAKKEGRVVMLELGSVGCRPCEQMKAVMEKLRANYGGKLDVIFVDVRKDSETGRRFRVFVIPTQVFLDRKGREFHRHMGYYSYGEIVPVLRKAGIY